MRKFDPKNAITSQLIVERVTRTNDTRSAQFFNCERFEHIQYFYDALELPDGKKLQITGLGSNVHSSQSFNVFINDQLEARDLDNNELEQFFSKKYPAANVHANNVSARNTHEDYAPASTSQDIRTMYLIKGGTREQQELEFQKILSKVGAARNCRLLHNKFYDDTEQQTAAIVAPDDSDGRMIVGFVTLGLIYQKLKHNPWDVEVHDCSRKYETHSTDSAQDNVRRLGF